MLWIDAILINWTKIINVRHGVKEVWSVSFWSATLDHMTWLWETHACATWIRAPHVCPYAPKLKQSPFQYATTYTQTHFSTKTVHPHSWLMKTDRSCTDKHNAQAGQLSCLHSPLDTSLTSWALSSLQAALPVAWHSLSVYLLLPGTTNKRMRRASLGQPC